MKAKVGTSDFSKIQKEYDNAYGKGTPFSNPPWFIRSIKKIADREDGRKILDIACGDGHVLSYFRGYERYGVDISKEAIRKAKQRKIGEFYTSKAEKLPFPSSRFDIITCLGSLEHFVDMDAALKEMKRVAKKDSLIVIHVPNSRYLIHKLLRIETQHQTNERFATQEEWTAILSKYFIVEETEKYNTHVYLSWIPKKWSCHFTFFCRNKL